MENQEIERNVKLKIGKRLREARKKRQLSQAELAEKAFVSREMISGYENGKYNLSLDMARNIGRVLGLRPEYLLCEDNFPTENQKRNAKMFAEINDWAEEKKGMVYFMKAAIDMFRLCQISIEPDYGTFDELEDGIISTLDMVFPKCENGTGNHVVSVRVNGSKMTNSHFIDYVFTAMSAVESTVKHNTDLFIRFS